MKSGHPQPRMPCSSIQDGAVCPGSLSLKGLPKDQDGTAAGAISIWILLSALCLRCHTQSKGI
eukprot:797483-Amphidinium_carterae.1